MDEMTHHLTGRKRETPRRNPWPLRGALLLLFLLATGLLAEGQVRVWEGTLQLPVYEEGAPDPRSRGTLVNAVLHHLQQLSSTGGALRRRSPGARDRRRQRP